MAGRRRTVDAIAGLIVMVLIAGVATIGVKAALGAYDDEYVITASTSRTGFGLGEGSAVKIRGITVGEVDRVELLDDGRVELSLAIRDGIQIPKTAAASIEPVSVFGPKFVDVRPGVDEANGPYLSDADSLGDVVEPSELTETLDGVSQLLEIVDPDDLGRILNELARGFDGKGEQLGDILDASGELVGRLQRSRPALEALLADAGAVAETLAGRADAVVSIAEQADPTLDLIVDRQDPLAGLLAQTSELSARVTDVLVASGDELDGVLIGLEGGASVLAEHVVLISDFVEGLDLVSTFLGEGLFAWDRGSGRWGGIGHGIIDFGPCLFMTLPECPPGASPGRSPG